MKNTNAFTRNLILARRQKGMNQSAIAERLDITTRNYQKYEYGESFPRQKTLTKIAEILEVSISELLGEEPKKKQSSSSDLIVRIVSALPTLNDNELRAILSAIETFPAARDILATPGALENLDGLKLRNQKK